MSFTAREVAEMLDWPSSRVYGFVRSGVVRPERSGRALQFGFRDLVVLRAAKALIDRRVAPGRVRQALQALSAQLPQDRPLSATRLEASGAEVAIREHGVLWELTTGQGALELGEASAAECAPQDAPPADADDWFNHAVELEDHDPDAALLAYRRALRLDAHHCDSHVNIGRILQQRGELAAALHHYRRALADDPDHAVALFNAGTAHEEIGQTEAAIEAYRQAAPQLSDARYNLARLYEALGQRTAAIAELKQLVRHPPPR